MLKYIVHKRKNTYNDNNNNKSQMALTVASQLLITPNIFPPTPNIKD